MERLMTADEVVRKALEVDVQKVGKEIISKTIEVVDATGTPREVQFIGHQPESVVE